MITHTLSANHTEKNRSIRPVNYRESNKTFNHIKNALLFGVFGGSTLGLHQLLMTNGVDEISIGNGLFGFFLLTPFLYLALRKFRSYLAGGEVFKNGIIHGMAISVIASLVMVAISMIGLAWQISPEAIATDNNMVSRILLSGSFQILVGIVFGMTITFIILQGIKSDIRADRNIEKLS